MSAGFNTYKKMKFKYFEKQAIKSYVKWDKGSIIVFATKMLNLNPENSTSHFLIASAYNGLGNKKLAYEHYAKLKNSQIMYSVIKWCERLHETYPNISCYGEIGTAFYHNKQYNEAVKYYEKKLEKFPDSESTHTALGIVYDELLQDDKALYHFKKALEIKPNSKIAKKNLDIFEYRRRFLKSSPESELNKEVIIHLD